VSRRLAASLLCTAILAATIAGGATAATGPGNQRAGIVSALNTLLGADRSKVTYVGIKLTSVPDRAWAIANVDAKPAFEATFQSFVTVLVKVPDLQSQFRWVVADLGSAFVGCGVAPLPVLRDLTGTRRPCPPAAFGQRR
jgi:hypothetical protein